VFTFSHVFGCAEARAAGRRESERDGDTRACGDSGCAGGRTAATIERERNGLRPRPSIDGCRGYCSASVPLNSKRCDPYSSRASRSSAAHHHLYDTKFDRSMSLMPHVFTMAVISPDSRALSAAHVPCTAFSSGAALHARLKPE
jgi:hypothetical protein